MEIPPVSFRVIMLPSDLNSTLYPIPKSVSSFPVSPEKKWHLKRTLWVVNIRQWLVFPQPAESHAKLSGLEVYISPANQQLFIVVFYVWKGVSLIHYIHVWRTWVQSYQRSHEERGEGGGGTAPELRCSPGSSTPLPLSSWIRTWYAVCSRILYEVEGDPWKQNICCVRVH